MYLVIKIIILLLLGTSVYAGLRGAPWVPTKKNDIARVLKLSDIKKDQKMIDLGCGNGRIVFAAAKKGIKADGLEVSLFPFVLAKLNELFANNKNARIKYRDMWSYNLADVDLVYFFLTPKVIPKLKKKFEDELRPGTKVISYVWPIEGWEPIKIDTYSGNPTMYLYQFK